MTLAKAANLLRQSLELCGRALDGETDPATIEGLNFVREQLEIAIARIEEAERPAIPLKD